MTKPTQLPKRNTQINQSFWSHEGKSTFQRLSSLEEFPVWAAMQKRNPKGDGGNLDRLARCWVTNPWSSCRKNGNSVFSAENNSMSTSFGNKLVTRQVTIKISKLVDNASPWWKNWISFFSFPYFRALPPCSTTRLTSFAEVLGDAVDPVVHVGFAHEGRQHFLHFVHGSYEPNREQVILLHEL